MKIKKTMKTKRPVFILFCLSVIGLGSGYALNKSSLDFLFAEQIENTNIKEGKLGVLYDIHEVKNTYYDFNAKNSKKIYALDFFGRKNTLGELQIESEKTTAEITDTTIWVVEKKGKMKIGSRIFDMVYGKNRNNYMDCGWLFVDDMEKVDVGSAPITSGADESAVKLFQPKKTINVKENNIASLSGDGESDDSKGIKILFEYTKTHPYTKLYFPTGDYSISPKGEEISQWRDRIMIPMHDHTIVEMDKDARIVVENKQTFTFYSVPTSKGYNGGLTDFHWIGGGFARIDMLDNGSIPMNYTIFSLFHATNCSFENSVFDSIQNVSGHNYDIAGSQNIIIRNNKFIGYGFTTDVQPSIGNNSGQHPFYSEIVELDFAYPPGPHGDFSAFGLEVWSKYTKKQQSYADDLPCRKITIANNYIKPKYNEAGRMISYAQNLVGTHINRARFKNDLLTGDILIDGNNVVNPVPVEAVTYKNGKKKENNFPWTGIMHFTEVDKLNITNNTFIIDAPGIAKRSSIISMFNGNSTPEYGTGAIFKNNNISKAKGHFNHIVEWGGVGKQIEELKSISDRWK